MTYPTKRIAIIGAGISGMSAALMLREENQVTLFEAESRLGGHARTIMAGKHGDQPVDTGFIIFNFENYPNLRALFERLGVSYVESNMSFGVSINNGSFEYGLHSIDALFAQRRNLLRPEFLRMVCDIFKFNSTALNLVKSKPELTIKELLTELCTGPWFRDYYLLPLSGAIWSTPSEYILDFPAYSMVNFFYNHGLLHHSGQHKWYTVEGGSVAYVNRLKDILISRGINIRMHAPVDAVRRLPSGVELKSAGTTWEVFDEVIIATHSDDALTILCDPTPDEENALGAIAYQSNDVVLHADSLLMPKRKKIWASWVYSGSRDTTKNRIGMTYWMNSLQPIPKSDPHFVTLNNKKRIREELIYDQVTLRHPVYNSSVIAAQKIIEEFNGKNSTWFCGAWMKHGFHEDGLSSAMNVTHAINLRQEESLIAK
ncbi:MAG: FAD-dependent oxidoreductase [Aestuariivita sp.]|nr:FAD-dependent oxidoreductase [Aestuariivita sp.]